VTAACEGKDKIINAAAKNKNTVVTRFIIGKNPFRPPGEEGFVLHINICENICL
jgi:hypothetical protein